MGSLLSADRFGMRPSASQDQRRGCGDDVRPSCVAGHSRRASCAVRVKPGTTATPKSVLGGAGPSRSGPLHDSRPCNGVGALSPKEKVKKTPREEGGGSRRGGGLGGGNKGEETPQGVGQNLRVLIASRTVKIVPEHPCRNVQNRWQSVQEVASRNPIRVCNSPGGSLHGPKIDSEAPGKPKFERSDCRRSLIHLVEIRGIRPIWTQFDCR